MERTLWRQPPRITQEPETRRSRCLCLRIEALPQSLQRLALLHALDQFEAVPSYVEQQARQFASESAGGHTCAGASSMHRQRRDQEKASKVILVVEDDADIGSLLVELITQETPYRAEWLADGLQAAQRAPLLKPDLLLTDYSLPHLNGIEVYDRLHATCGLANTPAIILSASLPEQELRERHLIGLQKPFDLDELLTTIEQLLL